MHWPPLYGCTQEVRKLGTQNLINKVKICLKNCFWMLKSWPDLEPEVSKTMRVLPIHAYYVSTYEQDSVVFIITTMPSHANHTKVKSMNIQMLNSDPWPPSYAQFSSIKVNATISTSIGFCAHTKYPVKLVLFAQLHCLFPAVVPLV